MMNWSRRGVLAGATALGASLAGCSALEDLTGGGNGYGTAPATDDWQQPRGTAGATGYNAAAASPPTERAFDATLEDGYYIDYHRAPLLIVNASEVNFADSDADYAALLEEIQRVGSGRHFFNPAPLSTA
jgi:hypothetical protein